MNKIDAFGIMGACLLAWIFVVFLVPLKILVFVYMGISAWAVGIFIGNLPRKLAKETDKDFLKIMFEMSKRQDGYVREMYECAKAAENTNLFLLAKIDALMFEYCPEDMTPKQIANYEAHVRAVSQQQEDAIERALNRKNDEYPF
jgi:hypothetical protein